MSSRATPRVGLRTAVWLLALPLGACPETPQSVFNAQAATVIERSCASLSCHGVSDAEALPEVGLFVHVDARGRLTDPSAARERSLERVTTTAAPHLSTLVRVPLAREHGGGPHQGGAIFASRTDPQARALTTWIDAETEHSGGEDLTHTDLEVRFAIDVLPTLVARCGFGGCHGPDDVANTAFPAVRDPE